MNIALWKKFKKYNKEKLGINISSEEYKTETDVVDVPSILINWNRIEHTLFKGTYPETFEGFMNWMEDGKPSAKNLPVKCECEDI